MEQSLPDQPDRPHDSPPFLAAFVQALGLVDLIVTPVGLLTVLALRLRGDQALDGAFVALLFGGLVAGITLGGGLIGLAGLLRYEHTLARGGLQGNSPTNAPTGVSETTEAFLLAEDEPVSAAGGDLAAIGSLLADLRDLHMLAPEDREKGAERVRNRALRHGAGNVIDAINARQLGKARILLRDAEAAFGVTPTLERLQSKIDEAGTRNEALDFARTRRRVGEAVNANRWAMAERLAHDLQVDHPDSPRVRQLWEDTRRARLYAHIQKCAEQHQWSEALAAAEEFLGRFPDNREAEALRRQLDTLRTNAEIVQRKQYEQRFKEFVAGEHYADALRIARHVIEQYPESPQAQALRLQMPALEKRVAG
ncbi:MAG: hypothetical protein KJ749_00490 [Planctomycetes bacterium]|nr:hypothetical protein [Planctomycetota bacterium]